jgi:hypothetical protein
VTLAKFRKPILSLKSWLFTPATRPDRFARAGEVHADALIIDLEDSVAPSGKKDAREAALRYFVGIPNGHMPAALRVNSPDTRFGLDDLQAVLNSPADPDYWPSEKSFLEDFAGDVDPVRARALYAVQGRGADALPNTKTRFAAWRVKPTWYQVSTADRTIDPELERFLAKRMNATTIELDSSHVSLVSHPKEIADLILAAAGRKR